MPHDTPLDGLPRLWLGDDSAQNAMRYFRGSFNVSHPNVSHPQTMATLAIYAESTYHVWVNGHYVGRGPTQHHPYRLPVALYEVKQHLHQGENVVAVQVHAAGIHQHNGRTGGAPGLILRLRLIAFSDEMTPDEELNVNYHELLSTATPDAWVATDQTGWSADTPRRSWAIGFTERCESSKAHHGWRSQDHSPRDLINKGWRVPTARPAFAPKYAETGLFEYADLPNLAFRWQGATALLGVYTVTGTCPPMVGSQGSSIFADALMAEAWTPAPTSGPDAVIVSPPAHPDGALTVLDTGGRTLALVLDLGAEYVGRFGFDLASDGPGTVDLGWSELLNVGGRPVVMRKGGSYADRITAAAGRTTWLPHGFSAGRYVMVVLRDFEGSVRFERLGMEVSEMDFRSEHAGIVSDPGWPGSFLCSDPGLNRVWDFCARTVRVGTQDSIMDCPTREQAAYIGDGHPNGMWVGHLTGDYRHWRRIVREGLLGAAADGQIRSSIFANNFQLLLDYSLLAVVGTRDYLRETGDADTVREVLPALRRVVDWYRQRQDADGILDLPWEEFQTPRFKPPVAPGEPERGYNIFIDHPGLGWHNQNEPGIDRRGRNAALNACHVLALRALAEIQDTLKSESSDAFPDSATLRARADAIAATGAALFRDPATGVFADGIFQGEKLPQRSQQTNTWALLAGFADPHDPLSGPALDLLTDRTTPDLARSGPYFWIYMLPLLAETGRLPEALDAIRDLWGAMIDAGATTCWETFAGDHLDSFCHPWSAAPVDFLPRHVGGIGPLPEGARHLDLRPRVDALRAVDTTVCTPHGKVRIRWTWSADDTFCELSGVLPSGVHGRLHLPGGVHDVTGHWTQHVIGVAPSR